MNTGVYCTQLKSGKPSYRASITYNSHHISLGSFSEYELAKQAYEDAKKCINSDIGLDNYSSLFSLGFDKFVSIINFRDNKVYIKNPIYLKKNYFNYYLSQNEILTFDIDDLFYYSNHRIQKRGGRLFCADFGMQITLNSRYGIKNHGVEGRDYFFINGDNLDYRYENICIINKYHGVKHIKESNQYKVYVHINGYLTVGTYDDENTAAIAYNKATDEIKAKGIEKNYPQNYIESISAFEYAEIYSDLDLSVFKSKLN